MASKQTLPCSLVSIERELDLAVLNAKRNKVLRSASRQEDPRAKKEPQHRVQIQENQKVDTKRSIPSPPSHSTLKSSMKRNSCTSKIRRPLEFESEYDKCIRSPVEQQAVNFMDELFGEWVQTMKAAVTIDEFTLSKVYDSLAVPRVSTTEYIK